MTNTKLTTDGNGVTVWIGLPNFAANPAKPTPAELNATHSASNSVAWDSYSFGSQASNQNSDPSLGDVGNTQTRGFAQFGGSMSFYYPFDYTNTANELLTTFLAVEVPGTVLYIIVRVDGEKTTSSVPDRAKPAVEGDFIRVYKVISDGWSDAVVGENSFKYSISFKPQGVVYINAVVAATTVAVATPTAIGAADYTVGGKTPLSAYITGRQLATVSGIWNGYPGWFDWVSSDPSVATVDKNGVVTGVAVGSADITSTWTKTGATSTALAVTIA